MTMNWNTVKCALRVSGYTASVWAASSLLIAISINGNCESEDSNLPDPQCVKDAYKQLGAPFANYWASFFVNAVSGVCALTAGAYGFFSYRRSSQQLPVVNAVSAPTSDVPLVTISDPLLSSSERRENRI